MIRTWPPLHKSTDRHKLGKQQNSSTLLRKKQEALDLNDLKTQSTRKVWMVDRKITLPINFHLCLDPLKPSD